MASAASQEEDGTGVAVALPLSKRRAVCTKCQRPTPRACICEALPDVPLSLQQCQLVVLQHPHEARRKNRSLPLAELCLNKRDMHTVVARRFGDQVDPSIMKLIQDPERDILLVYPSADAISLTEGLEQIQERRRKRSAEETRTKLDDSDKITVLMLDATWKYAREMEQANVTTGQYPDHLIRVVLRPEDWITTIGNNSQPTISPQDAATTETAASTTTIVGFQPRRFDIRTPPSANHLSTAECIAWVIATIEKDNGSLLYQTLMKPLDLMVEKWRSFSDNRNHKRSFTDGDGDIQDATNNEDDLVQPERPPKRKRWVPIT